MKDRITRRFLGSKLMDGLLDVGTSLPLKCLARRQGRRQAVGLATVPDIPVRTSIRYAKRLRVRQDRKSIDGLDYHEKVFGKPPRENFRESFKLFGYLPLDTLFQFSASHPSRRPDRAL